MSHLNLGFIISILISLNPILSLSYTDPLTQQKLDQVTNLPGQTFNVNFAHYAGYVTVNQENGRALFYWLTEATEDPASKPLVLWLSGGPGCSSIGLGMAEEMGPFHVNKDGKSVYFNPYSWNTEANLLFVDSPVGVGYSYSNTSSDIWSNGDKRTGESYAGHYVPQLSQAIVRYNKANTGSPINIKGYMVGNALTDDYHDQVGLFQFMWGVGMISDQTYKKLNELCVKESLMYTSSECKQITDIANEEMGNIDINSIFTPTCTGSVVTKRLLRKWHRVGHIGQSYDPCTKQYSTAYFNLPEVQNALHAFHFNSSNAWETCSNLTYWLDAPTSVLDVYQELISSGLRIWMFSGDTDAEIPTAATRYSINALNLTTISPWRAWWEDGHKIRGAGHEVPLHKPKQALSLLKSFLAGTSMAPFEQVIESKTDSASQQLDQVTNLPGQTFNVDFTHYAGYVTVNQENGRALFYWLTEATEDPASKPLVLWLNGGPGCSSIAFGMAEEVGPFHVNKDGKSVYFNPYSWNTVANLLFLDSPAGVGYSYSNTSSDIRSNGDKRTAEDALQFLLNWLERFPEYKGRDFYLTGESYAGHYVPQLSQAIVRYNKANAGSPINIKGYMVGNALTDDYSDHVGLFQFMWAAGMISDQTYKKSNELCDKESFIHPSPECEQITDIAYDEMGDIDPYSIFTPTCTGSGIKKRLLRKWRRVGHIGQSYDPCTEQHSIAYFNLPEVQNALHAFHFNSSNTWVTCSGVVGMYWQDSPISVLDVYQELISSGLRIWMFSGDTDAVIPTASTRYSIDALNLTTISPWRAWYEDGQVGGWTQKYEGLTFVTVRGAGHEVPLHRPKQALSLLKSFLAGTPMAQFEPVIESKTDSASQDVNSF
ncbi:hypothetical protein M8C21_001293 [Ambrosia artemisiifolia]|uniref:Carboxypeptidase n=1 Tax=Ambrosia artemisiifolia TaxID=4212 RepID=A0AAD5GF81_AMBAR|nr:hypothetical protein M8C21_001293 [Ambrosia artemisiifolia]